MYTCSGMFTTYTYSTRKTISNSTYIHIRALSGGVLKARDLSCIYTYKSMCANQRTQMCKRYTQFSQKFSLMRLTTLCLIYSYVHTWLYTHERYVLRHWVMHAAWMRKRHTPPMTVFVTWHYVIPTLLLALISSFHNLVFGVYSEKCPSQERWHITQYPWDVHLSREHACTVNLHTQNRCEYTLWKSLWGRIWYTYGMWGRT